LKWSDSVFWNSTHRKIVEVLKIDREVNSPKKKKTTFPAKTGSEKITVGEALKRF